MIRNQNLSLTPDPKTNQKVCLLPKKSPTAISISTAFLPNLNPPKRKAPRPKLNRKLERSKKKSQRKKRSTAQG